jgi:hypothetical protein
MVRVEEEHHRLSSCVVLEFSTMTTRWLGGVQRGGVENVEGERQSGSCGAAVEQGRAADSRSRGRSLARRGHAGSRTRARLKMATGTRNPSTRRVLPDKTAGMG